MQACMHIAIRMCFYHTINEVTETIGYTLAIIIIIVIHVAVHIAVYESYLLTGK